MAAALIFPADLDLCSAQLLKLLTWLQENHRDLYPEALSLIDATREEFEQRVKQG